MANGEYEALSLHYPPTSELLYHKTPHGNGPTAVVARPSCRRFVSPAPTQDRTKWICTSYFIMEAVTGLVMSIIVVGLLLFRRSELREVRAKSNAGCVLLWYCQTRAPPARAV